MWQIWAQKNWIDILNENSTFHGKGNFCVLVLNRSCPKVSLHVFLLGKCRSDSLTWRVSNHIPSAPTSHDVAVCDRSLLWVSQEYSNQFALRDDAAVFYCGAGGTELCVCCHLLLSDWWASGWIRHVFSAVSVAGFSHSFLALVGGKTACNKITPLFGKFNEYSTGLPT